MSETRKKQAMLSARVTAREHAIVSRLAKQRGESVSRQVQNAITAMLRALGIDAEGPA